MEYSSFTILLYINMISIIVEGAGMGTYKTKLKAW